MISELKPHLATVLGKTQVDRTARELGRPAPVGASRARRENPPQRSSGEKDKPPQPEPGGGESGTAQQRLTIMAVVAGEATSDRGCLPPLLDLDQPPASSRRAASDRDANSPPPPPRRRRCRVGPPPPRGAARARARVSVGSRAAASFFSFFFSASSRLLVVVNLASRSPRAPGASLRRFGRMAAA